MVRVLAVCLFGIFLIGAHAESTVSTNDDDVTDIPTGSPSTTSTGAPITTTTTSSSTTSAPTSTTPAPVTTSAPPAEDQFYRVTENNITCIMFAADMKFTITYPLTDKSKTNTTTVAVPKANSKEVTVSSSGSCSVTEQYLMITWGPSNTPSDLRLLFNMTGEKWELVRTQAHFFMDEMNFYNASDRGLTLVVEGYYPGLSNVDVDTNSSFTCRAQVESNNFTGKVDSSESKFEVTSAVVGLELQAYNSQPNTNSLQQGMRCEADLMSDLVPIAVGCALAGLVLLVLISYLVGRRRRSAAYQSV
ncbi:Lysosome-associated membrane glycoprotein [Trinorchestia longiramus]|nr:Lysosome-associated membrane glycoprotein [Trinorchestia longiramus]